MVDSSVLFLISQFFRFSFRPNPVQILRWIAVLIRWQRVAFLSDDYRLVSN